VPSNEEQIRDLIERWAEAVHAGDLPTVVADHADDIVMYDVPPPYQGVHGIDAYRDTWPGFFEWQRMGASFEIESLDVVAGDDVAFAYALLRCGTEEEFADNPDNRLRLTLGLRKEDGRWVVVHEHHSFPLFDRAAAGEREVRDVLRQWSESTAAQDLDGLMGPIADDVVSYEHEQPLQYVGRDAVREVCARNLHVPGRVTLDHPDLTVRVEDHLAVAWGLVHVRVALDDGQEIDSWSRGTRVFARRDGSWQMVHQHLSIPYDRETGEARADLRP
jgi:uncharacterized protein (TIGR02246 family)